MGEAQRRGWARVSEPFEMDGEMVVRVRLTQGGFALLNAEDAHLLEGRCWQVKPEGHVWVPVYDSAGRTEVRYLHRVICQPPPGLVVSHLNGDLLDCRRRNLAAVSQSEVLQRVHAHSRERRSSVALKRAARAAQRAAEINDPTCKGDWLVAQRKAKGLSLTRLAEAMRINAGTLLGYETGKRRVTAAVRDRYLAAVVCTEPRPPKKRDRPPSTARNHQRYKEFLRSFVPH